MKRTASVEKASRSSASSRRRKQAGCRAAYVDNASNPESLELRKIYRTMPDADATTHGYLRVKDESGEGSLYPERYFIRVALPRTLPRIVRKVLA